MRIGDDNLLFARHSKTARSLLASRRSAPDAAAVQRAEGLCSATAVVTALVELQWLLTAEVSAIYRRLARRPARYQLFEHNLCLRKQCCVDMHICLLLPQLPGNMMLALANALSASLSFHVKRTGNGPEAALQSAALAAGGAEPSASALQLSVGDRDGDAATVLLGTDQWLASHPAVPRMLQSCVSPSASAPADAATNLRALVVLAKLLVRGMPCCGMSCHHSARVMGATAADQQLVLRFLCAGESGEQAVQPSIVFSLLDGDLAAWLRAACSEQTEAPAAAAAFSLLETLLVPAVLGAASQVRAPN